LQRAVDRYNKNDYIIRVGDFNAKKGDQPIPNIIGIHGEKIIQNGKILTNFASFNSLLVSILSIDMKKSTILRGQQGDIIR
jgi:hypothetical protein